MDQNEPSITWGFFFLSIHIEVLFILPLVGERKTIPRGKDLIHPLKIQDVSIYDFFRSLHTVSTIQFFFFVLEEGGDNSFDRRRRRRDGRGSSFSKSNRGTRKDSLQHMELGTWDKAKEKIINS